MRNQGAARAFLVVFALGLVGATVAHAAPADRPRPSPPSLPRPLPGPDGPDREGAPPKETPEKQLERAKRQAAERRATRDSRARDARRELARSLRRWLRGGPMTDTVREELRVHARRTARLLRVQELAAAAGDVDTVKQVDRLLSRETSRYERALREIGRPSRPPPPKRGDAASDAGPAAPGPSASARATPTTTPPAGP